MAEILIKAVSATNPDPDKDLRGCYKRGDIVDVRPDGWPWGTEEGLPKFVVVNIPGLNPATVLQFIAPQVDATDPENPITVRRRIWNVEVDAGTLPAGIKNQLRDTGSVTVTVAQIRNFIRNRVTGLTF